MKRAIVSAVAAVSVAGTAASAAFQTVVPIGLASVEGNSASSTLFQTNPSSLQVYYSEAMLADAGITPGLTLNGLAYRRNTGGVTGPAGDTTMAEYNIFMSQSHAEPTSMTTTYASNVIGPQVQVYGSSLTFAANSMPGGATPNEFGTVINFSTGYLYTGGSLLIEIRRSIRTGDTLGFNTDFDSTPASTAGARMLFNTSSNTALTGTISNGAHVFQIQYIPAPSSVALLGLAGLATARRRR